MAISIFIDFGGDGPIEFDPTQNDHDPDFGDFLILSESFTPSSVTRKEGTNTYVFDPSEDPKDNVNFSYTITDSKGATDTSTITINVLDFKPTLVTGGVFIDIDNDRNIHRYPVDKLFPNQPDGGETVFIGDYMPATQRGGKFEIVGRGYFEYTPPVRFYGADVMTYTLETLSDQKGEVYVIFNKFMKDQPLQLHATSLSEKVFLCWPADPGNRFMVSKDLQNWEPYTGNIGTFGGGNCLEKMAEPGEDYNFRIER